MKKVLTHIVVAGIVLAPTIALAACGQNGGDCGLENPVKVNSISELILIVTRVIRYIAIPFIVIMIMYAGFLFIWANVSAKSDGIKTAKNVLFYTVIGAFILLSSELIALVMKNTIEGLTN